jgi:hypothetical protein
MLLLRSLPLVFLAGTVLTSCIEPYQPKISESYPDLLVIDGTIDATNNKAIVILTHSMALDSKQEPDKETAAQVILEKQGGDPTTLTETETGHYETTDMSINYDTPYRLTVKTHSGKVYQSSYVHVVQTPPIDSISWKPTEDGITIYANTHPPAGTTSSGYYQWNFTETWEYTSMYDSYLVMENGVVHDRTPAEDIYRCWKTVSSTQIIVTSSQKLSADVIREFPLTVVPKASYQLSNTYTINVWQRSLTEEAYNYWLQLQKTTQNVGGLFDPLPAQVTGNFTCLTDPEEAVLGFFSGSTVREQRIYIRVRDLPRALQLSAPYPFCSIDSLPFDQDGEFKHYGANLSLISAYGLGRPLGYLATQRACIDCTVQGGITTKPDFWE